MKEVPYNFIGDTDVRWQHYGKKSDKRLIAVHASFAGRPYILESEKDIDEFINNDNDLLYEIYSEEDQKFIRKTLIDNLPNRSVVERINWALEIN